MTPAARQRTTDTRELQRDVFGWLESPGPAERVVDCLVIAGWAFDRTSPLADIRVEGLGATVRIPHGLNRPDVAAVYPDDPGAIQSGFSGFVELDARLKGSSYVEVWATRSDMSHIRLFRRRIHRSTTSRGQSPVGGMLREAFSYAMAEPRILFSREAWAHGIRRLRTAVVPPEAAGAAASAKDVLTSMAKSALQQFLQTGLPFEFPASEAPQVSIVLVLWNRAELTLRCLRSLADQTNVARELIVVDNHSTDDTAGLLDRLHGATIIRNTENVGFTVAANQGARVARGEFVLFVNSDAEPLPGSLTSLVETMLASDRIGAVGGKLVFPDGTLQEAGAIVWSDGSCEAYGRSQNPSAPEYSFERDVDFCSGAFLLTRRSVFASLGGFDERYRPAYYEDADYCVRLWQRGLRVVYQPRATAIHFEFGSASSRARSIELQVARRTIFAAQHSEWLTGQGTREGGLLSARSRPAERPAALVIDDMLPEARCGAGFPRALELLRSLESLEFDLTLYSTVNVATVRARHSLGRVETLFGGTPAALREFLDSRRGYYDAVIVSRPHNMRYLKAAVGSDLANMGAPVIYDAEAVFAMREIGRRRLHSASLSAEEAGSLVRNEALLASGCSAVLVVNVIERRCFVDAGIERCVVLGHSVEPAPTPATFAERAGILFVGALSSSSPNEDAVLFFAREVLPILRRNLGEVRVTVAGANVSERVLALADEGLSVRADVEDLTPLYNSARVFVAPSRFGAGIPLKVLEAASRGVPVVCSGLLATQLGWRPDKDALIADTAEQFADALERLNKDSLLWERIRASALNRVAIDCNPQSFRATLAGVLQEVLEPRPVLTPDTP